MAAAALQPKWGNGQLTGSSAVHYSQKGGDTSECKKNSAGRFASKMMKSEASRVDVKLLEDIESIFKGECIYIANFFCKSNDFSYLQALTRDLEKQKEDGMVDWSKHLKHENPDFSPTFQHVIKVLSDYFDVDVYASRLNFYRDGTDWKPFHHDSHAYGGRQLREDFTMGVSFGASRELVFLHEPSSAQFACPQHNGDLFAFTNEVNQRFKHGVPKSTASRVGPRFSIVAWGRRRALTAHNSGVGASSAPLPPPMRPPPQLPAHPMAGEAEVGGGHAGRAPGVDESAEKAKVMDSVQVASLVEGMLALQSGDGGGGDCGDEAEKSVGAKAKRKPRLQGGAFGR